MHLHSHHSHDACDGDPQPDGVPDEDCLADLRAGLCTPRIDVAMISDHPTHATEAAYEELLLMRGMDEPILGRRRHADRQLDEVSRRPQGDGDAGDRERRDDAVRAREARD